MKIYEYISTVLDKYLKSTRTQAWFLNKKSFYLMATCILEHITDLKIQNATEKLEKFTEFGLLYLSYQILNERYLQSKNDFSMKFT